MKKSEKSYSESIRYLYSLQKFGIKFGLSKTANLLKALGNPHAGPKYIHIGGTNGKGSVATFIASVLGKAGYKVGLYSSPHLVRFTERFRINNIEITPEKTRDLINELADVIVPDEPPTFFEATTAMALAYFAREKTDFAVMEVGMGGRLDATNVISPLVSIITNISLEHQIYLGNTLKAIAGEKAGIIKEGIDLVTGATQPSVIGVFESVARQKNAPLWRIGKDTRYRDSGQGLHYYGLRRRLNGIRLGLNGYFQVRNAAVALTAIERLEEKGVKISTEDIVKGLSNASWPGRMQVVGNNPTIILDGAHNPAAIRVLARSIALGFKYRRLILVIGVMADKDIGGIVQGIVPISDYVIYTRPVYPRAAKPEVLATEAAAMNRPGEVIKTLPEAINRARDVAGPEDLIVITGSLFTVGEALACFFPEKYSPEDL